VNCLYLQDELARVDSSNTTEKEELMDQLHKRFTDEQIKMLLQGYCQGMLGRQEIQEMLGIAKTRFFALLKGYRQDPETFTLSYQRGPRPGLSAAVEMEIERALLREREIIEDPRLPISGYNYSALRDRLKKKGVEVSVTTIIRRAKNLGCYKARRKRKAHDRQVVTAAIGALLQHDASTHLWCPFAAIGALLQHDASTHLWCPFAQEKWALITTIDDFSRKLLFADFFAAETTWAHIQAAQSVVQTYGIPLCYYVDSLRVFRFVQGRDSYWRKHVLQTDDVDTQWRKMMRVLGVEVSYALSPQAKGKIERPYRWLQDRIVRTCILEKITSLEEARAVLREEVHRYNYHQVHSTTKEIPTIRFEKARRMGNSLFRPFSLPKPYVSTKDVFCLRETRMVNGYRCISLFSHSIEVPNVPLHHQVEIHLVPDTTRQVMHIRIWWHDKIVHSVDLPLKGFRVHF
jgi:hypothetical protein